MVSTEHVIMEIWNIIDFYMAYENLFHMITSQFPKSYSHQMFVNYTTLLAITPES